MRKLYMHIFSPSCRKIRIAMAEKSLSCDVVKCNFINYNKDFLARNPTGEVPVLADLKNTIIAGGNAICEYLDEVYPVPSLFGDNPKQRAEVRRLVDWFDDKFAREVTYPLLQEKFFKSISGSWAPDSSIIREYKSKIKEHFTYIKWLSLRRSWLAGENLSYADISAASHISVVDYFGDINWDNFEFGEVKEWYMKIKSRPSFQAILADRESGFPPFKHYADLDF